MTPAWRIDRAKWGKTGSFSGEGARLTPGRWNSLGTALVYAASSLSLATLEKFVHLGADGAKMRFVEYKIKIPKSVEIIRLQPSALPADWKDHPAPPSTQQIGDVWFSTRKSAALAVPSSIIPGEMNILLNPTHPDFAKIRIEGGKPYTFDLRLWK